MYSPNTILATNIVEEILKKKSNIKNAIIPLGTLNRFFNRIVQEIVSSEKGDRIPLHVYCFDTLLQKYGLKTIAEEKISKVTAHLFFGFLQT